MPTKSLEVLAGYYEIVIFRFYCKIIFRPSLYCKIIFRLGLKMILLDTAARKLDGQARFSQVLQENRFFLAELS